MIFEYDFLVPTNSQAVLPVNISLGEPSNSNQSPPPMNESLALQDTWITRPSNVSNKDSEVTPDTLKSKQKNSLRDEKEYSARDYDWDDWNENPDEDEIQRVEVAGHTLSDSEIQFELWLWEMKFTDFLSDPRNDYNPDPIEGAVYYDNVCTQAQHTSPTPTQLPAGVTAGKLNDLRNMISAAADEIKGKSNQFIEYGVFVYLSKNGDMVRSDMIAGNAIGIDPLPYYQGPDFKMIAFIHSHPTQPGEIKDAWRPSTPGDAASGDAKSDQVTYNDWLTKGHADPNALVYILDGSGINGNGSGNVYEYRMAGSLAPRAKGANISQDCQKSTTP